MGLFKKVFKGIKNAGRFAAKTVGKVVKPVLSIAAGSVGGPVAAAAVNSTIGLIGEKKVGEMTAKVVSDGVVKTNKVQETLQKLGVPTSGNNINTVVTALKNAAAGMSNKSVGVSGFTGGVSTPSSSTPSVSISFKDRVIGWWNSAKNWTIEHKKPVLIGVGIVVAICVYYFGFGKRKKWRV
nr:hypothetical protein [uncultured Draconibacterium sp.]